MSNTIFTEYQGKFVELYETELVELEANRLRIHRAPHSCRFLGCEHADWYISDRVLAFHERKKLSQPHWKMPTSCPNHRNVSKQQFMAGTHSKLCPTTSKRSFKDETDAQEYADTLSVKQHVYNCNYCGEWHLSSLSAEQQAELAERKRQRERETTIGSFPSKVIGATTATPVAPVATALVLTDSTELAACKRYTNGERVADISTELKVSLPTIYGWLKKHNVPKRAPGRPPGSSLAPISPFKTQIDLDEEEARALAAVEAIRHRKKLLEEAKKLRVEMVGTNAFRIMKEGEHATLPFTELEPLIDILMALVPSPEAVGAVAEVV